MTINLALILGLIIAVSGLLWIAISSLRRYGRSEQQLSDIKSLSDIQAAQAKAVANSPKDKASLLDRLKNGDI